MIIGTSRATSSWTRPTIDGSDSLSETAELTVRVGHKAPTVSRPIETAVQSEG